MEENNMDMGTQETQTTPEMAPSTNEGEQKSTGSIVGIIIVVIIIILGGFYFWNQKVDNNGENGMATSTDEVVADLETELVEIDAMAEDLESDLADIEAELAE